LSFFFLIMRLPPSSTLFPYTTLFRSNGGRRPAPGRPHGGGGGSRADGGVLSGWRDLRGARRVGRNGAPATADRARAAARAQAHRSEEHTSELQSLAYLVCRLLLEKKK